MNKEYLVWGNGVANESGSIYKSKKYSLIKSSAKQKVENIYIKDDGILYISQGDLYKEGQFNFEKSDTPNKDENMENSERKLIKLISNIPNTNELVVDCAIGENHVLILTLQGNVYSWGDNYFGQLGLGNCFIAKVFEPHQLKLSQIKRIYAYKNNSFALDFNNKLWVWGKTDFLGNNLKGNVFKPIQIMSQFNIENLKISDGRIVVAVVEDLKALQIEKHVEEQQNSEDELEKIEKLEQEILDKGKKKKDDIVEKSNGRLMHLINKINDDISDVVSKLNSENKNLTDIRTKILSDDNTIKRNGLDNLWTEINSVLNQTNKMNKQIYKINTCNLITIADTIDVFSVSLDAIITGCFQQINVDRLADNFFSYEKETLKLISEIKPDDLSKDENIKKFVKNIQYLLSYFLKYKKLETLIHKMSAHQFLLKSFRFENVLDGLKFINEKDENVEKKLYLIERSFESLKLLIDKTNTSLIEIDDIFGNLSRINFTNDESNIEKFLHKYVIESTLYIRDLWLQLITHVENERKSKEKEEQMIKVIDNYKELYSIQMYLRSISLKNIFTKEKNKSKTEKEIELKKNIILLLTEVDGAICRLETILNNLLNKSKNKSDNFSIELIVMYATCLLDNAYQKKVLFELVYSIEKKKFIPTELD